MSLTVTLQGYIESTHDSLLVFEACRRGILPRVSRRLKEKERQLVQSGAVFCFDEEESGIKRWTDGLMWSPSRILGNFLVYRELDKRISPSDKDKERRCCHDMNEDSSLEISYRQRERALVGSLTDSHRFKKGGLIKKSMSLIIDGVQQHLVSYYTKDDVFAKRLNRPFAMPELAGLEISPELLIHQNFRIPLYLDMDPDGKKQKGEGRLIDKRMADKSKEDAERSSTTLRQMQRYSPTAVSYGPGRRGSGSSRRTTGATYPASEPWVLQNYTPLPAEAAGEYHQPEAYPTISPPSVSHDHSRGSPNADIDQYDLPFGSLPQNTSHADQSQVVFAGYFDTSNVCDPHPSTVSFGVGSCSAHAFPGPMTDFVQEQNPHQHLFSSSSFHHINHAIMPLRPVDVTINSFMLDTNILGTGWNEFELQM